MKKFIKKYVTVKNFEKVSFVFAMFCVGFAAATIIVCGLHLEPIFLLVVAIVLALSTGFAIHEQNQLDD